MGADNVALELTHRFELKEKFNILSSGSSSSEYEGVFIGDEVANIDIGDIPAVEALRGENVGGILGTDLLLRADLIRFHFDGTPDMTIYKSKQ
eukprot:CAMPEP_0118716476 /NCGR_PEP_ID=MMETSP0800-20121206/27518_1 /TAXON_ID=210618 ORGANISM="Striatella unipunctata, Strain CCMP2910" /NCGR_SAMPLE_ID=MMETSP0800 /ASSEMBLY_ACC=CAM_ASM_000638 /LENGTH=92 /DNA_ID=CAMNT_0006622893 /DNA_START=137 /DNA_END=415 /DNA_ORIENTATION=+